MNKNLFKTYLLYFIVITLFVGVRIASNLGAFSWISDAMTRNDVATIVIQCIVLGVIPFLLYMAFFKAKPKQVFERTYYKKINFKSILICFGIGILLFILNLSISTLFNGILQMFGYSSGGTSGGYTYDTFGKFILGVVFVAILPAVFEEFTHRGILMRNIALQTNYKKAILISALCFGLMHLNIEQFFYATILGIIIGYVGAISESIVPCMILHFTNNFISVYLTYAKNANLWGGDFYTRVNNLFSNNSIIFTFIFLLFVLALVIVGISYLIYLLFKETRMKKLQNSFFNIQKEISGENLERESPEKLSSDFQTLILPHLQNNEDIFGIFLPPSNNSKQKQTLLTNIFIIASLFLGILITIFTFVWGIV